MSRGRSYNLIIDIIKLVAVFKDSFQAKTAKENTR